jgi:hypothetical protein
VRNRSSWSDMGSLSAQAIPVHKVVHVGDLHNTVVAWVERWSSADRPRHSRDPIMSCSEQHFETILSLISQKLCF